MIPRDTVETSIINSTFASFRNGLAFVFFKDLFTLGESEVGWWGVGSSIEVKINARLALAQT